MPKDKYEGTDPDPDPFLYVSKEQKRNDSAKSYDAKKSCWIPDDKEGFVIGEIKEVKGDQIIVTYAMKERPFKKEQVSQVNPPKFDKCEDMSHLTYLNDASVLWNLKDRYYNKLIYTYSGLFCVSVNPYERFPIYTERVVRMYEGKKRTEKPPHIFAVSDGAYRDMLNNIENQSMLITGESGAGKTENTKKVISYFATVGANAYKSGEVRKVNLEDQVVQTNPVLEAFGNAKTVRNDNSSRFGKFIRIHFTEAGKLAGADIETYLLEKARVISQQSMERSYHIFYQIMSDGIPGLKDILNLQTSFEDFPNQSMGKTEIDGVDDKEEMEITDNCMDVLGFTPEEKESVYRIVAAVMHLGTMKFKQRGREEQAEADGTKEGEIVAKLLNIDCDDLYRNLLKPKIKVGSEIVTQGRNKDQVFFSIGALCKAMYDRLFSWLVQRCNTTLSSKQKKSHFIGVLDIAGFEIFEWNSFEQLCINFTNEKLQQFFNHHMFVLEQEEYQREGIQWTFIDFGMDLQACIDLIEKPLGIFSILEEESMFPKASDKTFEEKLKTNHMGKNPNFARPKSSGGKDQQKEAHFAVVHYAGTVGYNVTGWLEKNKDPLNDTVVEQFKKGNNILLSDMFSELGADFGEKKAKRSKGSTFQTVSALYREQVENLLATLRATAPHFIRCIIPNELKAKGNIDPHLVMHQLTCNGVLEGIRICRKGFPNRMHYKDFRERYNIIAAKEMRSANDKDAAAICCQRVGLEEEQFRLGHTKVFFRAGVLGIMEEKRDERIKYLITSLQAQCRCYVGHKKYLHILAQREALVVIQRVLRLRMNMRLWLWWKLWTSIKPLLQFGLIEDRVKELEAKVKAQQAEMVHEEKQLKVFEKELDKALESKQKTLIELEERKAVIQELEEKEARWREEAMRRAEEVEETQERLAKEEEIREAIEQAKKKAEVEIKELKKDIEDLEISISKAEQDRASKDHQIRCLNEEIQQQDDIIAKVTKEKKMIQEVQQKTSEELQVAEDKNNHLVKLKNKLESTLDDLEDALEKEKRARVEQDKYRRKAESDLKMTQVSIEAVERTRKEAEAAILRKDKELLALADKLEEEQTEVAKGQKQIKEMALRMDDIEDELESERSFRAKSDKQRNDLAKELEELQERLEEAGGATAAQQELNKKREMEISKMKRDLEEASIQQEAALAALRKKHLESMNEMNEQMESQNRMRQKLERDKATLQMECKEAKMASDRLAMEKAALEKDQKMTLAALTDFQGRLDESQRINNDLDMSKKKLSMENCDLSRHLEEAESQIAQLNKLRVSYSTQLADLQRLADDEAKERAVLQSRYRHIESDRDSLRQTLEDELEAKADLQRQLSKAAGDATMWRAKYETESVTKIEDLEHAKMKLQARMSEAEDTIEGLNTRCTSLEKQKQKLATEVEDMQLQVESANNLAIQMEKRSKNFDKVIGEWKQKLDELTVQLDQSQRDYRESSSELYRVRAALEEAREQLDASKRENKNLTLEVKDLLEQIGDGGRTLHEVEKQCRKLEEEKEEMANALDEAEAALEQEENRTLRYQLELAQSHQETERRVHEKEEEFENSRKTLQRLIDSLQASLEAESKGRAEALRMKKKLEADIQELEIALDHASKANVELQKLIKRHQTTARELQQSLDDADRQKDALKDSVSTLERKSNGLANELEEARTFLEQAERSKKLVEQELTDSKEKINELLSSNQELVSIRRKLEADLLAVQTDLEEAGIAIRNADDKSKKAIMDAIKLADELKLEQEKGKKEEQMRRQAEAMAKELQIRVEDAEANAIRGGRKLIEKLEAKVRNLTADLDCEHRWKTEYLKGLRKSERRLKEVEFQLEEEHKSYEKLQDLCEKLQNKLRIYKKQVEDAEEIAALNLAKFRKAQSELEEADQRANLSEQALYKYRTKSMVSNTGDIHSMY